MDMACSAAGIDHGGSCLGPRLRLIALNILDALLVNAAILLALLLRFDGHVPPDFLRGYLEVSYFATLASLVFLNVFKVHRTLWRYAGVPTALAIVNSLTLAFAAFYGLNLTIRPQALPRSVVILSWILSIVVVLGIRLAWKALRHPPRRNAQRGRRILIVGAGDVGAMVARELARSLAYPGHPVGFVDDDPRKQRARVENLEVLGTTFDLPRLLTEKEIGEVILSAPSAPGRLMRQVVRVCLEKGVTCRTVPALADYIEGKGALDQVREVQIEDLLGRDSIQLDLPGIRTRVLGKTVLVTGAGGSIGSELCRQIARFSPGRLVMLDHNENGLTYLGLELQETYPKLDILLVVGDIKDEIGVHELFATQKPQLVFHAAAHKHVNLLERRPREAILNNVMGTRNVARACDAVGVETLTLISTDKAVNPSSVMGASKRACEMVLQTMAGATRTTMVAVRFGNVIGSEGSVLPIFRRQLARGGPLTVTHPEARRFFMTIPEASQLVIQAALLGQSGDVFLLDMGEPVRILDVARQLIRLSGLEPDRDIRIEFIGLRPGEKLEEELLTQTERTRTTRHSKIFKCELDSLDSASTEREIDSIIHLASHAPADEIRSALKALVHEYREVMPEPLPPGRASSDEGLQPSRLAPTVVEPAGKRTADLVAASISLVLLAVPAALAWLLVHLAGPAQVVFQREERIGVNRRASERRSNAGRVGIDRRYADRRTRELPGRPFVTYRIRLQAPSHASPAQRRMARLVESLHLDRLLYLWSVLRGDMSLVGPSAHLVEGDTWRQDSISAWTFARRPGLTGPSQLLAGQGEEAFQFDRYYGRHANWRLDIDSLRRALPRLVRRPTDPSEVPEVPVRTQAGRSAREREIG
jgi:FlaA1/EpsC-like NDP-sugar epimerase/lipopolysaccharide/colanic/teichoic acid biosynthesis glycosyltransferase